MSLFDYKQICEYSNHDDVKHLFDLKTDKELEMEQWDSILGPSIENRKG
jgi:hypothetical protein